MHEHIYSIKFVRSLVVLLCCVWLQAKHVSLLYTSAFHSVWWLQFNSGVYTDKHWVRKQHKERP